VLRKWRYNIKPILLIQRNVNKKLMRSFYMANINNVFANFTNYMLRKKYDRDIENKQKFRKRYLFNGFTYIYNHEWDNRYRRLRRAKRRFAKGSQFLRNSRRILRLNKRRFSSGRISLYRKHNRRHSVQKSQHKLRYPKARK